MEVKTEFRITIVALAVAGIVVLMTMRNTQQRHDARLEAIEQIQDVKVPLDMLSQPNEQWLSRYDDCIDTRLAYNLAKVDYKIQVLAKAMARAMDPNSTKSTILEKPEKSLANPSESE